MKHLLYCVVQVDVIDLDCPFACEGEKLVAVFTHANDAEAYKAEAEGRRTFSIEVDQHVKDVAEVAVSKKKRA